MSIRSILAIVAVTWSICFAAATTQVAQAAYEVVGASGTGSDGAFYCDVCDFSIGRCYSCRCVSGVCDCIQSGLAAVPGGTGPKAKSAAELQRDYVSSKAQPQREREAVPPPVTQAATKAATKAAKETPRPATR